MAVGAESDVDLVWNVTRGDDGTIIETIDPNNPRVGQMLREELEKTQDGVQAGLGDRLLSMTVQEKMLLLLKLLRDRVKVEAVVGNDAHARNLRILAYCLKAANDEERHELIFNELGNSLDVSLAIFICTFLHFCLGISILVLIAKMYMRIFTHRELSPCFGSFYSRHWIYSRILSRPPPTMPKRDQMMTNSCLAMVNNKRFLQC